jgi:predicted nucleic acid-binding protein
MSRTIFLDTGPLGVLTNPKKPPDTLDALRWAANHIRAGNQLMVPSIADYEVRRELERLKGATGIASLDAWNSIPTDRYVSLTDSALRLASKLWAQARNAGTPTADPKELDCDVLIAAQALDYQATHGLTARDVIVATSNVGHLSQFLAADLWRNITP